MSKIKYFRDVYKFPLQWDRDFNTKVFTKDHAMAFDFPSRFMQRLYPNQAIISKDNQSLIIDCLNGVGKSPKTKLNLKYNPNDTIIYLTDEKNVEREFIIVRGWGNLTGCGGHELSEEKAVKIQTAFAEYIIDKLTNII